MYRKGNIVTITLRLPEQKKKKIDLTSYTKVKSKRTKDLTVRPRSIKPLEENIDRTLFDINLSKIFFDTPPRVMKIKTKIKKWDLIAFSPCL